MRMRCIHYLCCGTVLVRKLNYLSRLKKPAVRIKVLSFEGLFFRLKESLHLVPSKAFNIEI